MKAHRKRRCAAPHRPLRILFLARTNPRRAMGGIAKSVGPVSSALAAMGNEVLVHGSHEHLAALPADTDIVLHYGDYELIEEHLRVVGKAGVPIVLNSQFNDTTKRCHLILENYRAWSRRASVFFGVFTEQARQDPRLEPIRARLVVLPKTIRIGKRAKAFAERGGVCIGELIKSADEKLVVGFTAARVAEVLHRALPGVPLYVYNQYGRPSGGVVPRGVEIIDLRKKSFPEWLGGLRLFVSTARYETFYMVPLEAQSVGTPVIYQHMPQSLDTYIGSSGYVFGSVEEMVLAAARVYGCPALWDVMSRGSAANAIARADAWAGPAFDIALREVLRRVGRKPL